MRRRAAEEESTWPSQSCGTKAFLLPPNAISGWDTGAGEAQGRQSRKAAASEETQKLFPGEKPISQGRTHTETLITFLKRAAGNPESHLAIDMLPLVSPTFPQKWWKNCTYFCVRGKACCYFKAASWSQCHNSTLVTTILCYFKRFPGLCHIWRMFWLKKKNVVHQPFWMGFGRSGQNILRTKTWLNATGLENSALNKW